MDTREKRYTKIAKNKAREYLRKKKTYKTRQEKKAFRIAEKFRINQWKKSLSGMEASEAAAQLKAFKVYRSRIDLLRNLILLGVFTVVLVIGLIVLL